MLFLLSYLRYKYVSTKIFAVLYESIKKLSYLDQNWVKTRPLLSTTWKSYILMCSCIVLGDGVQIDEMKWMTVCFVLFFKTMSRWRRSGEGLLWPKPFGASCSTSFPLSTSKSVYYICIMYSGSICAYNPIKYCKKRWGWPYLETTG